MDSMNYNRRSEENHPHRRNRILSAWMRALRASEEYTEARKRAGFAGGLNDATRHWGGGAAGFRDDGVGGRAAGAGVARLHHRANRLADEGGPRDRRGCPLRAVRGGGETDARASGAARARAGARSLAD